MPEDPIFKYQPLWQFSHAVFTKINCPDEEARLAADVLLSADLRGIDSHGLARLSGYVRLWEAKRINSQPKTKIVHARASTAVLDGDGGLGLVVAPKAMEIAIEKANNVGTGWVAVKNSNHFGIAAYHAMMALPHDMIGIAFTNASPLVAPTFSVERLLGTNPMCFAIPGGGAIDFVADLATAAAANGKLEIAQRENKNIPEGWLQTQSGEASQNAHELKHGGSLLTLGSNRDLGSHKGFALSAVVDIFCGVLSGANYGPWVPPFVSFLPVLPNLPGEGLGHFFGAMRIDAFRPKEAFYENMQQWIARFKNAQTAHENEHVIIPGEPEYFETLKRKKEGIPLHAHVLKDLEILGFNAVD
jgi:LDH2 family malate/lactate/ureidoglycolate dehydrogenase